VGWLREMTAAALVCGSCGTELPPNAKFCNECGAAVATATTPAEYKQVTVLFADVVHSMDIAAAVGAERLREIMAELVDRATAVVQRYGGTVDKFTGDGIMAVFGAPVALEDHAVRACLSALAIQEETARLAAQVKDRDGIDLRLRVGLNSGQVIAGEVGSRSLGYTTIGEQVGVAQRMESVAPPGGVMLSASTARLVDGAATLGAAELVQIKGADAAVPAQRLLGMGEGHRAVGRAESNLVGRRSEMSAAEGLLGRATDGHGAVVGVVGPPGIGKSRLVREVAAMAGRRGVEVSTAFCESHTSQVPFHTVARLLRAATGVEGLDGQAARDRVRDRISDADPEDLLLLDDLLGIADPNAALPAIDPDARRRRLTALLNAASLARETPTVYVVEDAHWIDAVSESMIADFLTVIPQTPSLVLVTYRPEYEGALTQVQGAQTIALGPLSDAETAALVSELLGQDPSLGVLPDAITGRAAGNPFFIEEIARELAERGVLRGQPGEYISTAEVAEVRVPATVQATIAARIDRLPPEAKRTLSAAAVIGSLFGLDLLTVLAVEPAVDELVAAQLIDQVTFTRRPDYAFHHPLIRTVAYESQLKSDRAKMHRRVAAAIEAGDLASADENAALIAEHLEAAGDLHAAYGWHMRAATWATNRDIAAARLSWERARKIADVLPAEEPHRTAMRIAPRTMLCGHAWRAGGGASVADAGFDELRELCGTAGDQMSLVMGASGLLAAMGLNHQLHELQAFAPEYVRLLESIGNPVLIAGLLNTASFGMFDAGEIAQALQLFQRAIDAADGDTTLGNFFFESPLAWAITLRGLARCSLGEPGWRDDLQAGLAMAREVQGMTQAAVTTYGYAVTFMNGALMPDTTTLGHTADALRIAERSGDDVSLAWSRVAHGIMLVRLHREDHVAGLDLLAKGRQQASAHADLLTVTMADVQTAECKAHTGDFGAAAEIARPTVEHLFDCGEVLFRGPATRVLAESLLRRGTEQDLQEAQTAIDRLAACPTDTRFVLYELPLLRLRALLARARGDDVSYRDFRDRYRDMAKTAEFEGHMAWAGAMP
jgi:adenylate cyclase